MDEFTGTPYISSEQHKETRKARLFRDEIDTNELANFFEAMNPFRDEPSSLHRCKC